MNILQELTTVFCYVIINKFITYVSKGDDHSMKNGRLRKNSHSIFYRAIVSLTIVAVFSLLVVFAFFYPRTINAARTRVDEQRNNAMQQTVQAMDSLFSQAITLSTIIERESSLRPYTLRQGDTVMIVNAKDMISQLSSTQRNVAAMFYHIIGSDWVIGNDGAVAMSSFGKDVWRLGTLSQTELHQMMEQPANYHLQILPRTSGYSTVVSSRQDVLPFLISISSRGKSYASLLILFDANSIASELVRSWQDDAIFISNGEQILFSTDSSATDILSIDQRSGSIFGQALANDRALYVSPSKLFGFSYGAVCRSDVLQAELRSLRNTALLFIMAALLGILLLTMVISRWNYQPVRQFCADVGVDLSVKRSDSDLLRARFEELMQTNRDLAESLQTSHKALENTILQRLLVSIPQERELWIERGINAGLFAGACRCTIAICLSDGSDQPVPVSDACFVLHRIPSRGHDALLLMHRTTTSDDQAAVDYFSTLLPGSRICYAPLCEVWNDLPDTYELLLKQLPALRQLQETAVIALNDPRLQLPPETLFGEEALHALSESLRDQSADDLRFAASLLSACLGEEARTVAEMRLLTFEALQMMCASLESHGLLNASALERMNPLAQGCLDEPKRMKSLLNNAVEIVLASFPKVNASPRNPLSQDVLVYIEEHLLDPNFSIYTISEAFGLSESAFSHLFKRTFHETYSSYVSKQKLIHAFDLLCDESIPLEEVALRLGYSRGSNFGRMFKAEMGMSPGKYRNLHLRNRSENADIDAADPNNGSPF